MTTRPTGTPDQLEFGSLEREIMILLWQADEPLSADEVHDRLRHPGSVSTVATVLGILVRKGYLARTRRGRVHLFAPRRTQVEYQAGWMYRSLMAGADTGEVIEQFVHLLAPPQANALRAALDKRY